MTVRHALKNLLRLLRWAPSKPESPPSRSDLFVCGTPFMRAAMQRKMALKKWRGSTLIKGSTDNN